jgi:uncharacterized protein
MNTRTMSPPHPTRELPAGMTDRKRCYPVYYLDTTHISLAEADTVDRVNDTLYALFCRAHAGAVSGQAFIKVHIGEPRCTTRLRPDYTSSAQRFLAYRGAAGVVAGDTTVAYTGRRGHRQNPPGDVAAYMGLAEKHGWSVQGPAGVPFVVLDRLCTAIPGVFAFADEEHRRRVEGCGRYRDFYLSGGFAAANFMVNSAHLTLHGLAGLAGCVKNIAMGCAGLTGKLRMHQFLLPGFDADLCTRCGICVSHCPEHALVLSDSDIFPQVTEGACIGCGECVSVCPNKAVHLFGKEIHDWSRGEETLPLRMADYTLGLMNGFWEQSLHVLHMYSITELCDCVSQAQKPFVRDIGFLVGKNPFAVDRAGAALLRGCMGESLSEELSKKINSAELSAAYVHEQHGILSDPLLQTVTLT